MMSYPNGPVAHKTLDHPDMHILAALAEAARLDVRFIVLLRGAEAVVHSTVDLRSFGSLEPQILIANAEAIYAQLNLISPAFYMCLQYEKLVNVGLDERQRTELISFLHPTVLNMHNLHSMLSKVRKVSHNKSSSREWHARHGARNTSISSIKKPLTNRQYQVHQLQARLDLIGKLCTAQDAWL